jgi:hypothetical protein
MWIDLVPKNLASQQTAWERRCAVLRARNSGATVKQLQLALGLSRSRVEQLLRRAEREARTKASSPIERYFRTGRDLIGQKI